MARTETFIYKRIVGSPVQPGDDDGLAITVPVLLQRIPLGRDVPSYLGSVSFGRQIVEFSGAFILFFKIGKPGQPRHGTATLGSTQSIPSGVQVGFHCTVSHFLTWNDYGFHVYIKIVIAGIEGFLVGARTLNYWTVAIWRGGMERFHFMEHIAAFHSTVADGWNCSPHLLLLPLLVYCIQSGWFDGLLTNSLLTFYVFRLFAVFPFLLSMRIGCVVFVLQFHDICFAFFWLLSLS